MLKEKDTEYAEEKNDDTNKEKRMRHFEFDMLPVVREAISRLKRSCSLILMEVYLNYKLQFEINIGGISL